MNTYLVLNFISKNEYKSALEYFNGESDFTYYKSNDEFSALFFLEEADATEGFRQTIQGSEFSCETDRHVNVCCTKR